MMEAVIKGHPGDVQRPHNAGSRASSWGAQGAES